MLLPLLFFLIVLLVQANQLERLVEYALKNNPYLRSFTHTRKALLARSEYLRSLPNPELRLTLRNWDTERLFISPENPMSGVSLSFLQRYTHPTKRKLSSEVYEERSKEVSLRRDLAEKLLVKEVKQLYYDFLFTFAEERILRELGEELGLLLGVVEENYRYNRALLSDILMVRAEILSLRAELERVRGRRKAYLERIYSLVGGRFPLHGEELRLSEFPGGFTPEKAIKVRLLRSELRTLRRSLERAGKEHLPDFTLFAEYTFREGMVHLFSVGVGLSLPFWYERREKLLILEEMERLKGKERELEWVKLQVSGIYNSLRERYHGLRRSLAILEEEIREKEKEIKALLLAYRYQEADVRDVVRAYRILLDLKLKRASLVRDMNRLVAEAEALL